ncbi:MAG: hypothetical protein FI731_09115 [SAR202 cluster bacterium]|nr:hypothetical protein [SAR202 cluster bacterium]|tara:strand:+ start:568 stop:1329 length:762 start_codon:yes stop_codon:yes gene_type:complete
MDINKFITKGFDIVAVEDLGKLQDMRHEIYMKAAELVGGSDQEPEDFMNNFHKLELRGTALNTMRMDLIRYCSEQMDLGQTIFDAFSDQLINLLGPDVVVQKTTNLVIQQPGDPDQVPTHRDSPLNSPFEIVCWIPLVNIYGTKGMYVLDRDQTDVALNILKTSDTGYDEHTQFTTKEGEILNMPFGHALFFWPGLVHAVGINEEQETRWALNIRYKNLFAPAGSKGQSEFFKVLQLSPLTKMALEYEKGAYA